MLTKDRANCSAAQIPTNVANGENPTNRNENTLGKMRLLLLTCRLQPLLPNKEEGHLSLMMSSNYLQDGLCLAFQWKFPTVSISNIVDLK